MQSHPEDGGAVTLSQPIQMLLHPHTWLLNTNPWTPTFPGEDLEDPLPVRSSTSLLFHGASKFGAPSVFSSSSIHFFPGQCNLSQGSSYSPQFHFAITALGGQSNELFVESTLKNAALQPIPSLHLHGINYVPHRTQGAGPSRGTPGNGNYMAQRRNYVHKEEMQVVEG